jgi:hypothetical protein
MNRGDFGDIGFRLEDDFGDIGEASLLTRLLSYSGRALKMGTLSNWINNYYRGISFFVLCSKILVCCK